MSEEQGQPSANKTQQSIVNLGACDPMDENTVYLDSIEFHSKEEPY